MTTPVYSVFEIPFAIEMTAVSFGALSGALHATRKGMDPVGVFTIAIVTSVGGGIIRDVLVREEPLILKPGQFYAVASAMGVSLFVALKVLLDCPLYAAAGAGITLTLVLRLLSLRLNWTTRAIRPPDADG